MIGTRIFSAPERGKVGYARAVVADGWVFVPAPPASTRRPSSIPPTWKPVRELLLQYRARAPAGGHEPRRPGPRGDLPGATKRISSASRRSSASTATRRGRPTPRCSPTWCRRRCWSKSRRRRKLPRIVQELSRQPARRRAADPEKSEPLLKLIQYPEREGRASRCSRAAARGGLACSGSSNAECAVKRVDTFGSVSNTLNTIASFRSICGK